jgi:biopolymer transport protein ExbD
MSGPDWGFQPERAEDERVELNLTSLVDVVFTLLVIFLVSSTAIIEQRRLEATAAGQVDLVLPAGQGEEGSLPASETVLQIDPQGRLFENGAPVELGEVEKRLRERLGRDTDLHVRLEADQGLSYQRVMEVITRLQDLGVRSLGLATRAEQR